MLLDGIMYHQYFKFVKVSTIVNTG